MNDSGKPFRITVEHFGEKISIEMDNSEVRFEDYMDKLKAISTYLFSPTLWAEYFEKPEK